MSSEGQTILVYRDRIVPRSEAHFLRRLYIGFDKLKPVWIATSNCGISRFDLRDDGFIRVVSLNDTSHLAKL